MYAGLVLLATHVRPLTSEVAVAGSTLVAAALFNPLRRRVQHHVDRRFNRARFNAELTVAAFAARLQDATERDVVRADLTGTVYRALEPVSISLWLTDDSPQRPLAHSGAQPYHSTSIQISGRGPSPTSTEANRLAASFRCTPTPHARPGRCERYEPSAIA